MISKEEVKHIAGLARIGVTEKDLDKMSKNLSAILDWMGQLDGLDLEKMIPTAHISGVKNVLREDEAEKFSDGEKIIKLFPEEQAGYDKVKSIL